MAKLTRKMLEDWGISVEYGAENSVIIKREWPLNLNPNQKVVVLTQSLRSRGKYGNNPYFYIHFLVHKKTINVRVHRIVYAWEFGECPDGFEIDHIDGNPANNHYLNLRLVTKRENLSTRNTRNQYTKGMTNEQIVAHRMAKLQARKLLRTIAEDIAEEKREYKYFSECFHSAKGNREISSFFHQKMRESKQRIKNLIKEKKECREKYL